ncbi:2,3-bisphosphoglycerate-independent phosphoglycerate mutase [bacterium]|jgi:2,3-bisphosphoglycerate-independent phosphoglycerate mutase|nr:2,3-bisphosphoglycerate-independent phosphoglycerate mutase [bacterium]
MNVKPTALVILDGLGYGKKKEHNAFTHARTPNLDKWLKNFPHAIIDASGKSVGLPDGYMGNSEVGHITIGAGKIVKQQISIINSAIQDKTFYENTKLNAFLTNLEQKGTSLHIMGLLSDAGVHSHIDHLFAYIKSIKKYKIKKIFIHAFLDGRDTPPYSAKKYLELLEKEIQKYDNFFIASIHGRFYSMDRDQNWNRTEQSYLVLTQKQAIQSSWKKALEKNYLQNISDEFIPPTQILIDGTIQNGDGVIFFNFRPDRARQLTKALVEKHFAKHGHLNISFLCSVPYTPKTEDQAIFKKIKIEKTLFDWLSEMGKTTFTIAETEKYAHVTYFFNGGKEIAGQNETRVLIPSLKTKNYIDNPEMSAKKITQAVIKSIQKKPCDFYLINYANPDMVGHSGDFDATVKAIEFLDKEIGKLYTEIVDRMDGTLYVTSDHGNAECMFDTNSNQNHTQHTTNPVFFIAIDKSMSNGHTLELNGLADITPFILKNFG